MITQNIRDYFYQGATRTCAFRIDALRALRSAINANRARIHEALTADLAKPTDEIDQSEINFCLDEINLHMHHLAEWMRPQKIKTPWRFWPASSYQIAQPYGVTLIISPWNFPFQLSLMPLIGAISAGNCAIIKPSEYAPASSQLLEDICSQIFSSDYIRVIQGDANKAQEILKEQFDYLFFTGSTAVGKKVMAAAAQHLTPCTLELGGSNPCIIDQTANIGQTARRIAWAKMYNAGQSCVAPNMVIVHEGIRNRFVAACRDELVKYSTKKSSSIVNMKHFERLRSMAAQAKVIFSGNHDPIERKFHPTIIEASLEDQLTQEEIFGPILPIVAYRDLGSVITHLTRRPKPLALYIFSDNTKTQKTIINSLTIGTVCINDCMLQVANHHLPFGGVGSSGFGNYHGKATFDAFSHYVSIMKRSFWAIGDSR